MSVAEAQERISAEELTEWIAFSQIEPIGRRQTDVLLAQIPFVIASMFRGKKGKKPRLSDFLPAWKGPRKRVGAEEIRTKLAGFARAHNAVLAQRGRPKVR